jgi:hypothetical protein
MIPFSLGRKDGIAHLILRPTYWKGESIDTLQALPTNEEPVTSQVWDSQDQVFYTIVFGIIHIL